MAQAWLGALKVALRALAPSPLRPGAPEAVSRTVAERAKGPGLVFAVVLLLATVLFRALDVSTRFENVYVNLAGSIVFVGVASFVIANSSIRGFGRTGSWPLLWLGAGSLVYGIVLPASGLLLIFSGANAGIAAHNLGTLLAGLLHCFGAFFTMNGIPPHESEPRRRDVVRQVYGFSFTLVALVLAGALFGVLPTFFVQDQGGTPLRQLVVGLDAMLFLIAGLVYLREYARARTLMVYWYALGLLLTALGLAGVLLITGTGTSLSWTGRVSQWAGGLYLLVAAWVTLGEARARQRGADEVLASYFFRREANLRLLFDSIHDAVIVTDQDFVITAWNQGAEAMYGWPAEEVIGRSLVEVVQTVYADENGPAATRRDFLATGGWRAEVTQHRRDGREIAVLVSVSAVKDEFGRIVGALALNRDVTERRRAEQVINQLNADLAHHTDELEASNQELEAFAYSVSHDLRAPLRGIDGFSQALEEDYADRLDAEGLNYLHMLRLNAQRMGQLIDDLLTLSRVGRQQLQRQPVRLADVAQRAWDDLAGDLGGRTVDFRRGVLPVVQADSTLMRQVYANLLSNALKFTRERDAAVIETGCSRVDNEDVFYVKDNGVGFDMRYVDKIFGVFQRLHRTEDYQGTGVGLAIVQRIIQRHGGRIWAESRPGEGACFYFTLGGGARDDRTA